MAGIPILLVACAHTTSSPAERVLERGGELANARPDRAVLTVNADTITAWGMTEVPDGSRMQMAFAGVDAITRAELLKAIQVRVVGVTTDVESTDPARRSLTVETVEVVDGVLARGGPLPHGWARIQRGDRVFLRVWSRLEVPRASVETAVTSVLERHGRSYSPVLLEGLTWAAPDETKPAAVNSSPP